jgi:carbonic anhydrase/acetyltransferase-like protein (isoleucine patch superfamily)
MMVITPLTDSHPHEELVEINGAWYYRHTNGGGLVAITARVADTAYLDSKAMVKDHAVVAGNVRLFHKSVAEGGALLLGMSTLRDNARVGGSAVVRGVTMKDNGYVGGSSRLDGNIRIEQCARIVDVNLSGSFRFT